MKGACSCPAAQEVPKPSWMITGFPFWAFLPLGDSQPHVRAEPSVRWGGVGVGPGPGSQGVGVYLSLRPSCGFCGWVVPLWCPAEHARSAARWLAGFEGWLGGFLPVWPWFLRFSVLVSLTVTRGWLKKQVAEQDPGFRQEAAQGLALLARTVV